MQYEVSDFIKGYITALIWSEHDDDPEDGPGVSDEHSADDLSPEAWLEILRDCADFELSYGNIIERATHDGTVRGSHSVMEQAGHDFALTRNGHGAGFWDGDWAEPHAQRLTDASKAYGTQGLYVGDDGLLYTHD
jgi:hypothetical protein